MFGFAHDLRKRVFSSDEKDKSKASAKGAAENAAENQQRKLADVFFRKQEAEPERDSIIRSLTLSFTDGHCVPDYATQFVPQPTLPIGPRIAEYDELALLLHASLERGKNKRRYHEYDDTFYGKHAIDWLVGAQVFPDAADARNAMRHLLNRRLIYRADHTIPIFNNALERVAPKLAQSRKIDLVNRHAGAARGFHDNHLYRFPPEAFSKTQVKVRVMRARNLKYRTRMHIGTFVLSAKFRDQKIDPYCSLEFGSRVAKTDTWSTGSKDGDPEWDMEFNFPVESNHRLKDMDMKDLWIRIFDFHEVLDDAELGFCMIPASEIEKNCAGGKVWTAWHLLMPSAELSINHRTTGEVELAISITPYIASNPLWTVHQEARSMEPEIHRELDLSKDEATNSEPTIKRVGNFVGQVGDHMGKVIDKTLDKGGLNEECEEKASEVELGEDRERFILHIYRCNILGSVAEANKGSLMWMEYQIVSSNSSASSTCKGKSEMKVWPVKDMGELVVRGLTLSDIDNASTTTLYVRMFGKVAGLITKIGEASTSISKFLPNLDTAITVKSPEDLNWRDHAKADKLSLRKTVMFRRNRKKILGEIILKACLEPDLTKACDQEDDQVTGGLASSLQTDTICEEELSTAATMLAENGFTNPEYFPNLILEETLQNCPFEKLFFLVLSKKSPVLNQYFTKRGFKDVKIGEWKWGMQGRRGSYIEEDFMLDDTAPPKLQNPEPSDLKRLANFSSALTMPNLGPTQLDKDEAASAVEKEDAFPVPMVKQDSIKRLNEALTLPPLISLGVVKEKQDNNKTQVDHKDSDESLTQKTLISTPTSNNSDETQKSSAKITPPHTPGSQTIQGHPSPSLNGKSLKNLGETTSSSEDFPYRMVTYTRPPEFPVKELHVKEIWRLKSYGADKGFVLEIEGTTDEPTYGKQMSTMVQIVGKEVSETVSSVRMSSMVKWYPRPFSAGIVERSAIPGTATGYQQYTSILKATSKRMAKGNAGEETSEGEEMAAVVAPIRAERQMSWRMCLQICMVLLFIGLVCEAVYIYEYHRADVIRYIQDYVNSLE